jgi:glycosyltransferase involved in cell wall biosynthesis
MRLLFVAPGAMPPWTEGRRNFVRDLVAEFRARGVEVDVARGAEPEPIAADALNTAPSTLPGPMQALRLTDHALRVALRRAQGRPTHVLVFPYGRFDGARGLLNRLSVARWRKTARAAGVPSLCVLYSCAGRELDWAARELSPCAAIASSHVGVRDVHLGIAHASRCWQAPDMQPFRILFMAGYQQASSASIDGVLYERGLDDLLRSGSALVGAGIELTIAIPFLRVASARTTLARRVARLAPELSVRYWNEVSADAAFTEHHAFVFPYRRPHAVFVPTSLLEAVSAGIPVIASEQPMYRRLLDDAVAPEWRHTPGDVRGLMQCLRALRRDYDAAVHGALLARARVRQTWTLARAADDVLAALAAAT